MPTCKNCKTEFPNRVEIDGKIKNLQNRKYCLGCSPFGLHNTKKVEMGTSTTKICSKCGTEKNKSQFHRRGKDYKSICKECSSEVSKISRIKKKSAILQHAGSTCTICGYSRCPDALDFHHKDPSKKDFQISAMGNRSMKKILKEIDKCILVCAVCHREIHAGYMLPKFYEQVL